MIWHGSGTPGRAKPDRSNALAGGISPRPGRVSSAARDGPEVQHTNRYATVLTYGFLLPLVRERRAATAGATGNSR